MKQTSFLIAFWLVMAINLPIKAQDSTIDLPGIIPPSPEVANLFKFTDIPVNYHTGLPDINIPVYNVSHRDIQVPISASYHAGGIRVEEEASWIGLGWVLNAGGVIGRTIRGADDMENEHGYGYGHPDYPIPEIPYINRPACLMQPYEDQQDYWFDYGYVFYVPDEFDFEPDQFYFNFPGASGKFVFEENGQGKIHLLEAEKIEIKPLNRMSWQVRDAAGYTYLFGNPPEWNEKYHNNGMTYVEMDVDYTYVTAWHLRKIISPKGAEVC